MAVGAQTRQNRGYTIIEIIVVVMMLGILLPAVFSILYAILQQQLKVYRITETKRQGDLILEFMKEKISRDGASIYAPGPVDLCVTPGETITTTDGNNFRFRDDNNNTFWFNLTASTGDIRYRDAGINALLDNTQVTISNFEIGCIRRRNNTIVQFSYTASFNDLTPSIEEGTLPAPGIALNYVTKIRLR